MILVFHFSQRHLSSLLTEGEYVVPEGKSYTYVQSDAGLFIDGLEIYDNLLHSNSNQSFTER